MGPGPRQGRNAFNLDCQSQRIQVQPHPQGPRAPPGAGAGKAEGLSHPRRPFPDKPLPGPERPQPPDKARRVPCSPGPAPTPSHREITVLLNRRKPAPHPPHAAEPPSLRTGVKTVPGTAVQALPPEPDPAEKQARNLHQAKPPLLSGAGAPFPPPSVRQAAASDFRHHDARK